MYHVKPNTAIKQGPDLYGASEEVPFAHTTLKRAGMYVGSVEGAFVMTYLTGVGVLPT